ncbi:hypothetical protein ACFLUE_02720 [Chloroflexota bacterium]
MTEDLGKIAKPLAEDFKEGRKLYFIPVIYCNPQPEAEYLEMYNRYWNQVENQIGEMELKLGMVSRIYHELIPAGGDDGVKTIEELNKKGCQVIKNRLDKGARLEAMEDGQLLTEFTDWGRCLAIGLQNQQVITRVYDLYRQASQSRNEYITQQIAATLKENEIGILFTREGHQLQFAPDIKVFYVTPPALDEIKRWFRDREAAPTGEPPDQE